MKTNTKASYTTEPTREGAPSARINSELQLRRSIMTTLLWESSFYENGVSISDRICSLVPSVRPEAVAAMAVEARDKMKLRHVPLLLCREMAKHDATKPLVAATLARVIQRPDELCEFLSLYSEGRTGTRKLNKLSNQAKKGLAKAFCKFDAFSLGKYNQGNAIKLRDVLAVTHAKPKDAAQAATWKKLLNGTLPTPDIWEKELSASKDKKESWTRLLSEGKLGILALLRNLRNFTEAGVSNQTVTEALRKVNVERALPFRFITAARYAPSLENELETAMFRCLEKHEKLPGKTVLLIDVSGSMDAKLSAKSELTRLDAACALAMLAREICEQASIFAFSTATVEVPARRGFALRDAICGALPHGGTNLGAAVCYVNPLPKDRLIVFTDEQSASAVPDPTTKNAYCVNVASEKNGVGYGKWNHIDGFSEAIIDFILALENDNSAEKSPDPDASPEPPAKRGPKKVA